jgi:hypothetical protein
MEPEYLCWSRKQVLTVRFRGYATFCSACKKVTEIAWSGGEQAASGCKFGERTRIFGNTQEGDRAER